MSIYGKNIIITGGTRGIGKAIVMRMVERGANIAFTYLSNYGAADSILNECKDFSGCVKAYQVDVRNQKDTKEMVADIIDGWGSIDVVINNAGIRRDKTLSFMSLDDWNDVISTNLYGAFYLTQATIFHMLKKKSGRVIFISSVSGIWGIPGQVNYSSSKAALLGFTRALAKEVAPYGIAVNAVAPGGVETDMVLAMSEKNKEKLLEGVPLKRLCRAEEVARVVEFLADDTAAPEYLTGAVIPLDGGLGL